MSSKNPKYCSQLLKNAISILYLWGENAHRLKIISVFCFVLCCVVFFFSPAILFGLVEDLIFFHKPHYNDIVDFITTRYSGKDEYIEVRATSYCSTWSLEDITENNYSILAF